VKEDLASISIKREVRPHGYFLFTADCLLESGLEQKPVPHFMASSVFSAFALEAYLNWLGGRLFPHWAYLERLKPTEKLALISDQLKLDIDSSRRPWQTVWRLFRFRNQMAHGKPEQLTGEVIVNPTGGPDKASLKALLTEWEKFATAEYARDAREDVQQIIEQLHFIAKIGDDGDPFEPGQIIVQTLE